MQVSRVDRIAFPVVVLYLQINEYWLICGQAHQTVDISKGCPTRLGYWRL